MAVIIIASLIPIPHMTMDTSLEGMMNESDPKLIKYNEFCNQFGRDEMVYILIETPDVFDLDFLDRLKNLHNDLKRNVPYTQEITSLINARNTYGKGDDLFVEPLFRHWPETVQDLSAIKKRIVGNALYTDLFISSDANYTAIVLKPLAFSPLKTDDSMDMDFSAETISTKRTPLTPEENQQVIEAIRNTIQPYQSPDMIIRLTGTPVLHQVLNEEMIKDMTTYMTLTVITILTFLFLMFRRVSGVVLPIIVVYLSLGSTVGLMALFGGVLKMPTSILPSFLIAIGVSDSVHLLVLFFRHYNSSNNKEEALVSAMRQSGIAILMTSLTTAGGIFSLSTADIAPISDLGIYGGIGVLIAFIYSVILLPALLSLFPIKPKPHQVSGPLALGFDRMVARIGDLSTKYPFRVLGISFMIVVLSVIGITHVRFSYNSVKWLPEENECRKSFELVDFVMNGSFSLEIVIDTGKENGIYDPQFLSAVESSIIYIENLQTKVFKQGGKAISLTHILKEVNQALHSNNPGFYTLPDNNNMVAQELFLFENNGGDDVKDFTDSQFKKIRIMVKIPNGDAIIYVDVLKQLKGYFAKQFPQADITITGMAPLFARVITNTVKSMAESYILAFVVISFLMILLIGRIGMGILSMIPNLTPVFLVLGLMGWLNIPMDPFTMLVASVGLGLAVDDTIHFFHHVRHHLDQGLGVKEAIMETLNTTGRAMLITSVVLASGFFVFTFASMVNITYFGFLAGTMILLALLSDFFISPALLILFVPSRQSIETMANSGTQDFTPEFE